MNTPFRVLYAAVLIVLVVLCATATQVLCKDAAESAAQESKAEPAKDAPAPQAVKAQVAFPGLAEVAPQAAELAQKAAAARETVNAGLKIASLTQQAGESEKTLQTLKKQIAEIGDVSSVDIGRTSDLRILLHKERKTLEGLVAAFSARISELDALREDWDKRRIYWQEWRSALAQSELPAETFARARGIIAETLQNAANALAIVLPLQDKASRLLQECMQLNKPVDAALARQREEALTRNEPSFASRAFWREVASATSHIARGNFGQTRFVETIVNPLLGSEIGARLLFFLLCAGLAWRYRRRAEAGTTWSFLLLHPLAAGYFLSAVLAGILLPEATGSLRILLNALLAVSVGILARAMPSARAIRPTILFLASALVAVSVFKIASFPFAYLRLFLTLISGTGTVLLWLWAGRISRESGTLPLPIMLRLGALTLALSALAQASGFVNAADNLLLGLFGLVFLFLGALLLLRACEGIVDIVLSSPSLAARKSVVRFGPEIAARLKTVAKVAVLSLSCISLFRVLGVFASTDQALETFFHHQFRVGPLKFTLGLTLLAAFLLYLSSFISWLLRTILDGEVFPRKQIDPGARQSIAKLLHYFIIFVGFLTAISVLGFELQSFAVLGGALGVGIGFGLQNIVNNFVSGLILLFERPIKIGDRVTVDSDSGIVRSIGLRSTVIETYDRAELIVPNSQFISHKVLNMTLTNSMARLKIPLSVAYGNDVNLTLDLLREIAAAHPHALPDPPPAAYLIRFGDSSLDFELHVWLANVGDMLQVKSDLCQVIDRRFREAGIEIPFPKRDLPLRSEGTPAAA